MATKLDEIKFKPDSGLTAAALKAMVEKKQKRFTSSTIMAVLLGSLLLENKYDGKLEAGKESQSLLQLFAKDYLSPEITQRDIYTRWERGKANFYGKNKKLIGQVDFHAMKTRPELMLKFIKEFPAQLNTMRDLWTKASDEFEAKQKAKQQPTETATVGAGS